MARAQPWIVPRPEGIYLPPADAWIDPATPRPRALITHGHSDHARPGSDVYLSTPLTAAVMRDRFGGQGIFEISCVRHFAVVVGDEHAVVLLYSG